MESNIPTGDLAMEGAAESPADMILTMQQSNELQQTLQPGGAEIQQALEQSAELQQAMVPQST